MSEVVPPTQITSQHYGLMPTNAKMVGHICTSMSTKRNKFVQMSVYKSIIIEGQIISMKSSENDHKWPLMMPMILKVL